MEEQGDLGQSKQQVKCRRTSSRAAGRGGLVAALLKYYVLVKVVLYSNMHQRTSMLGKDKVVLLCSPEEACILIFNFVITSFR